MASTHLGEIRVIAPLLAIIMVIRKNNIICLYYQRVVLNTNTIILTSGKHIISS
jgi:hypothetical protein